MAYCIKCGAYIPDGHVKCLACGFDEEAEARAARQDSRKSGAATEAKSFESIKEELEKQRRLQQEKERRWAEEEYARRRQESEKQPESPRDREPVYRSGESASINKILAALSYLSVLFILPMLICPRDSFARFHARQGLVLFVFSVIADIIGSMLPIGWVLTIFRIYCIIKGMGNALSDRMEPLPYIGKFGLS